MYELEYILDTKAFGRLTSNNRGELKKYIFNLQKAGYKVISYKITDQKINTHNLKLIKKNGTR